MHYNSNFTVTDGLKLQADDLALWKRRLLPEVYEQLEKAVAEKTGKITLKSGYDVPRGGDIDFMAKTVQIKNKSKWSEIRADYIDDENIIHVDAWLSDDDEESGKTIAKIDEFGNTEYLDTDAKTDSYAQEIIAEVKKKINTL